MYRLALFCLLGLGLNACFIDKPSSETSSPVLISAAELRADLITLHQTLKKYHPGLFRYSSAEDVEKKFKQTYQKLHLAQDIRQFYREISAYLSVIKCGHTTVQFPESQFSSLSNASKVLPFSVNIIDNQLFIVENLSPAIDLPVATQILQIEGQSAQNIIQTLQEAIPNLSDGYNLSGKTRYIEKNFAWLFPIFFPTPHNNYHFELALQNPKQVAEFNLQLIDYQSYTKKISLPYSKALKLDVLKNFNSAILKVKSFDQAIIQSRKQNFGSFMDSAFQVLKNQEIKHLILDVRDNTGGDDDNMAYLLRYLIPTKFKIYDRIEVTANYQGYGKILPINAHQHLNLSSLGLNYLTPWPHSFKGKIWILQNGASFSATAEMLAILKEQGVGKSIGEESGGGAGGNTSGLTQTLRLKHSGLKVRIPQWAYYLAVSQTSKRGVPVDYPVSLQLNDLKNGLDCHLRKAFDLIQSREH
jgi:hypothetical protein